MSGGYAKVYISMPVPFLEQVDRLAEAEHLSRSALIREAVKLYMERRSAAAANRFFRTTDEIRRRFSDLSESELGALIDDTIREVRSRRGRD